MDLYAFLKLRIAAIRATNKMMGSASMKMGILPDVSVTSVDESSVRLHPQVRMIRPFWSLCLMCAIPCAINTPQDSRVDTRARCYVAWCHWHYLKVVVCWKHLGQRTPFPQNKYHIRTDECQRYHPISFVRIRSFRIHNSIILAISLRLFLMRCNLLTLVSGERYVFLDNLLTSPAMEFIGFARSCSESPWLCPYNCVVLLYNRYRAFRQFVLSRHDTCRTPRSRAGISRLREHRHDVLPWWSFLSLEVA